MNAHSEPQSIPPPRAAAAKHSNGIARAPSSATNNDDGNILAIAAPALTVTVIAIL